ncbi:MAG: sugar ABC transporter permease [Bacteroidales bacterium]|jgi:multiple sugar transport system permease protein|nr:sugar ABC transporter permease [Bacteroidales bacterium]
MKRKNTDEADMNQDIYLKQHWIIRYRPYLIMAPALIITIGIMYPFILAIFYSLTNFAFGSRKYKFIGLVNWINMFKNPDFYKAFIVTAKYAILSTGLEMLLGLGIALLLSKHNKYTKTLRIMLVFPLMVAPVMATLIWQLMLNSSTGIIEKMLNLFGVYGFPWASSPKTALLTVVMIDIWLNAPFVILIILAGIQSLPKSSFEAAKIDGGSSLFTFRNLTLPLLKPFIYTALIFRLMAAIMEFSIPFALTKGGPGNTLMNLSITAYNTGFAYKALGRAMPYVLIMWVLINMISQRLVKGWQSAQKTAAGK